MEKKKGKVRFIRVKGRIVPIREKKKNTSKHGTSLALLGSSIAVDTANIKSAKAIGAKDAKVNKKKLSFAAKKFSEKYKEQLKRARVGVKTLEGGDLVTLTNKAAERFDQSKKFINVGLGDEAVFTHELAHAQQARRKGSFNYKRRRSLLLTERAFLKSLRGGEVNKPLLGRAIIRRSVDSNIFVTLPSEIEATIGSYKTLRKTNNRRKTFSKMRTLLWAQSTYAGKALGSALLLGAVGKFSYDVLTGKKKGDK